MRFLTLKDHTDLPVEQIRHQFRNEEVRSVLPARLKEGTNDTLLVATTSALAIVSGVAGSSQRGWMTRWAPWDVVHLGTRIRTQHAVGGDVHRLAVEVDRLRFESSLPGEVGLRAMRDFVDASRARQTEVALGWASLASIHPTQVPPPAQ